MVQQELKKCQNVKARPSIIYRDWYLLYNFLKSVIILDRIQGTVLEKVEKLEKCAGDAEVR